MVNGKINAVLTDQFDANIARRRASQTLSGPFAGSPVMLKNLVQYKDADIDSGSRLMAALIKASRRIAKENSPLIDAAERAGMVVTGITNTPEFGLIETTEPVLDGPTRNPWDLTRTAGGSSGGSGAAVAAGIVPLAHGYDGGGSIRARAVFARVAAALPSTLERYDVILSPVMRVPPYEIGWHSPTADFVSIFERVLYDLPYTPVYNAVGTPAMSVPLNWTPSGLPVGTQFAARRGGEATLLRLAYSLEMASPWAHRRPPVFAV